MREGRRRGGRGKGGGKEEEGRDVGGGGEGRNSCVAVNKWLKIHEENKIRVFYSTWSFINRVEEGRRKRGREKGQNA